MARSNSYFLAPLLLVLGALLAAWNWYLQPERAGAWGASLALIAAMAIVLLVASKNTGGDARRRAASTLRDAAVFAGLILVVSLGLKVAGGLAVIEDPDFARRTRMVVLGTLMMLIGNALPKWLTPMSQPQCDGSRAQAFQRFSGWMWALVGVAYSIVWLFVPIDLARPVSIALLTGAMIAVASQAVRLRWKGRPA